MAAATTTTTTKTCTLWNATEVTSILVVGLAQLANRLLCVFVIMRAPKIGCKPARTHSVGAFIIRLVFSPFIFIVYFASFIWSSRTRRNSSFVRNFIRLSCRHHRCHSKHTWKLLTQFNESRICQWAMGTVERIEGAPELQLYPPSMHRFIHLSIRWQTQDS